MKYKLGTPKDLDSITKSDILEDKIWLWIWEAGLEDEYDEDWQVPLKGVDRIDDEFKFVEPIITLKIATTELIASASFDYNTNKIFGIAFWENNLWKDITELKMKEPIKFIAQIIIDGKEKEEFVMTDKNSDEVYIKE